MNTIKIKQFLFAVMALYLSAWASADTYTYDNLNRLTAVAYTGGGGQTYAYDPAGNLLALASTPPVTSNYTLAVNLSGAGSGTVTGSGINCGSTCSASLTSGATATLAASPAVGSTFTGWGGACTGTGSCVVSMNASTNVTATFAISASASYTLSVTRGGAGSGTVTGSAVGINCGSSCSASLTIGTAVTLTATADSGSTFSGWSGACSGTGSCVVNMSAAQSVTASFATIAPVTLTLSLTRSGTGSGTITSAPAGINCGAACNAAFTSGTSVTLTATAATGSTFAGWSGACSGTGTCVVTMSAAQYVLAAFAPGTLNGDGTVTDPTTGLTWMQCAKGQTWDGTTCTGTASNYTFDQANALTGTVTFAGQSDWRLPNIRELQTIVDRSVSNPAIDAGAFPATPSSHFWSGSPYAGDSNNAWYVNFDRGNAGYGSRGNHNGVRLVRGGQSLGLLDIARPNTDYSDQGDGTVMHVPTRLTWQRCVVGQSWNGSTCSGIASAFTWDTAKLLTSQFAGKTDWRLPTEDELVSLVDYSKYSPLINTALFPNTPSSYFWSGSPMTNGSDSAWSVHFGDGYAGTDYRSNDYGVRLVRGGQSAGPLALSVSKSGTGTISSAPAGIDCGSVCSASFDSGTSVTLTATAATGSTFAGWSGACSGTGTCVVTMNAANTVIASFTSVSIAGSCGGANGVATSFAPLANLCMGGIASAVATGSPWTWSCTGAAVVATCSAPNKPTSTNTGSGRAVVSGGTWTVNQAASSGFIAASADPSGKSPPSLPPGYSFPQGLLDFTLTTGTAGSAATVTITYPSALPAGTVYWKYGPTASNSSPHWYQFADALIAGDTIMLTITDGGNGDDDLAANGVIVDVGGPGVPSSRLINLSTRGQVQTGDNVMIGGFIIGGATPKKVLVRAVGPNLANYGVSGVLLDPSLQLFSGQTPIASNDDWGIASNVAEIQASGFAPVNGKESAILSTLNPGAYTAIVSGNGGGAGVGIVEVYELDHSEIPLINISTRGKVLSGDNVMIGGFIIQGDSAKTVLIRAVGPNLANYGVTGVLANPKLQLYSGQTVIASNDDWGTSTNATAITATGLAPVNTLESAILITLQPGAYTAIVSGADGGSGVGIVEVFAQ